MPMSPCPPPATQGNHSLHVDVSAPHPPTQGNQIFRVDVAKAPSGHVASSKTLQWTLVSVGGYNDLSLYVGDKVRVFLL